MGVLQFEDNYGTSRARTSNSTATLYKKTHLEQYTSHKEVIYSEPDYSSNFRSRYFVVSHLLKLPHLLNLLS